MKTLLNLLIKLGLACSVLYIVLIAAAVLLDGQVFEFEKHHVFVKDMGIILEESERMRLALPGLSLVRQFYIAAMNLGMENLGTQGIYKVFAKMNNIDL